MTNRYTLPAGTYRIGDPCYSIPDNLWSDFCEVLGDFSEPDLPVVTHFKDYPMVTFGTMYGDGTYYDEQRRNYSVDAALIGAIPVDFPNLKPEHPYTAHDNDYCLWHIIEFTEDVECYAKAGKIHFGDIVIDTAEDDDVYAEEDDAEWFAMSARYWADADEEYSWDVESEYLDNEHDEDEG